MINPQKIAFKNKLKSFELYMLRERIVTTQESGDGILFNRERMLIEDVC